MPSDPANTLRPVPANERPSAPPREPKDRHRHRSQAYQHKFAEISATDQYQFVGYIDPTDHFPDDAEGETRERVLEICSRLYARVMALADANLTDRQKRFLGAVTSGKLETQHELARALGVNQSAITKGMRPDQPGLARALRRLASKDPECRSLVAQVNELVDSPIFSVKSRKLNGWARYSNDCVRVREVIKTLAKRRFPDDRKAATRYARELWALSK